MDRPDWHVCIKCCAAGGRPTAAECADAERALSVATLRWLDREWSAGRGRCAYCAYDDETFHAFCDCAYHDKTCDIEGCMGK